MLFCSHVLSECWWLSSYEWSISVSLCFAVSPPFFPPPIPPLRSPSIQTASPLSHVHLPPIDFSCMHLQKEGQGKWFISAHTSTVTSLLPSLSCGWLFAYFFNSSENVVVYYYYTVCATIIFIIKLVPACLRLKIIMWCTAWVPPSHYRVSGNENISSSCFFHLPSVSHPSLYHSGRLLPFPLSSAC